MDKSIHSEEHKKLQNLLRTIRLEAKLTQVELAKLLNTSHSRISDYENGERRMDIIQLRQYCRALGLTLKEFINRFED